MVLVRIINNKIYIVRGETPTYDVSVKDKDTGAPYIIPSGIVSPIVEFVIRESVYAKENDFAFRAYLDYSNQHRFDSAEIADYNALYDSQATGSVIWDDDVVPPVEDENKLFRRTVLKQSDYRYWNGSAWTPYEFRITFQFPYQATSVMEPKTYQYEVALFDGTISSSEGNVIPPNVLMPPASDTFSLTNISYKKPLLEASDFVVGGSPSE